MSGIVRIRKHGKFYASYDDDALVIHGITKYKVSNGRIGFPESALGKVTNELENKKINYIVIENDQEVIKKEFTRNMYNKYLKEGKKYNALLKKESEMIEKIKNLDSSKLDKIISFIEEVCNE